LLQYGRGLQPFCHAFPYAGEWCINNAFFYCLLQVAAQGGKFLQLPTATRAPFYVFLHGNLLFRTKLPIYIFF
jgi:hypothetical protein